MYRKHSFRLTNGQNVLHMHTVSVTIHIIKLNMLTYVLHKKYTEYKALMYTFHRIRVTSIVLSATFNNNSVISWQSVLLVGEIGIPRENHRPAASHRQTLSHNDILVYGIKNIIKSY